jgi:S1-C subfamily serine protease
MALVTVVRSLVGTTLRLPGEVYVRPWHFVELTELSDEMRVVLRGLESSRVAQVAQVLDGTPLPNAKV